MRKTLLTIAITLTALLAVSAVSFAGNAIVDSTDYTHPPQFGNCMVIDGVDVSTYQANIDWEKVKRQGIDYAFIRLGFTYFADPFRTNTDDFFAQNYQSAKDAGVMVGVYYYSCATTIKEAQAEAKYTLDVLNGRDLDLPVVYDFELDSRGRLGIAYNSWSAGTRKAKAESNALAFLNYIEQNSDYDAMFYSYRAVTSPYLHPENNKINMDLIESKYKVWLAQYSTDNSYERPYEFWQYTSSGSVTGISGSTDCNFWYYDNNAEKTVSGTRSIKDATVSLSNTSYEYTKFQKKPTVTVSYGGATLVKNTDYKVHYIKNVLAGTGYVMVRGIGKYSNTQLVPITITTANIADGGVISDIPDKTYTASPIKPAVKFSYTGTSFKKDVDYSVSYSNNVNAGTATVTVTGKRNFHGTLTKTFKIAKADPSFTGYTSYSRTVSSPAWKLNTKSDSDANLSYKSGDTSIATVDNTGKVTLKGKPGVVTITVTSDSTMNYNQGTRLVKITVNPDSADTPVISTGADSYSKTTDDKPFNLNASTNSDGKITYQSDNPSIASVDSKGTVTLAGKAGKALITVKTSATENFVSAEKTVTVTVSEKSSANDIISGVEGTTIKASSALGDGFISLNWEKSKGYKMDYYEIYRSATGDFTAEPFYTTNTGTASTYKNTKNLINGTRYYYRIRGVRIIDGMPYYSQWSNTAYRTYKTADTVLPPSDPDTALIAGVKGTSIKASSVGAVGSITVNWEKSKGYKMDYYEIYRSLERENGYGETPIFTTVNGTKLSYKNTKA